MEDDHPAGDFAAEDLTLPPQRESYIVSNALGQSDTGWTHIMKLCAAAKYRREAIDILSAILIGKTPSNIVNSEQSPARYDCTDEIACADTKQSAVYDQCQSIADQVNMKTTKLNHTAFLYSLGNPPVMKLLLSAGAETALCFQWAYSSQYLYYKYIEDILPRYDIESTKIYLEAGGPITGSFKSPLITCLQDSKFGHFEEFLKAGIPPNIPWVTSRDNHSMILHECIKRGKQRLVHALLQHGADPSLYSPLSYVIQLYLDGVLSDDDAKYFAMLLYSYGARPHVSYVHISYSISRVDKAISKLGLDALTTNISPSRRFEIVRTYPRDAIRVKLKSD